MNKPTTTVVVPVFNGERHLSEALESLIHQTQPPSQVIVVDDGSTDGSGTVARRFSPRFQVISQPNMGAAMARNRGLREATGDFWAFLDADDYWDLRKLELQSAALAADSTLEAVFCRARQFYSPELPPERRFGIRPENEELNAFTCAAMLIRRESFLRVGLFRDDLRSAVDMEWLLRSRLCNLRWTVLDRCLYHRRIHGDNMGIRTHHQLSNRARLLKSFLDQKRNRNPSAPTLGSGLSSGSSLPPGTGRGEAGGN